MALERDAVRLAGRSPRRTSALAGLALATNSSSGRDATRRLAQRTSIRARFEPWHVRHQRLQWDAHTLQDLTAQDARVEAYNDSDSIADARRASGRSSQLPAYLCARWA
jgi:hypothetical protein